MRRKPFDSKGSMRRYKCLSLLLFLYKQIRRWHLLTRHFQTWNLHLSCCTWICHKSNWPSATTLSVDRFHVGRCSYIFHKKNWPSSRKLSVELPRWLKVDDLRCCPVKTKKTTHYNDWIHRGSYCPWKLYSLKFKC